MSMIALKHDRRRQRTERSQEAVIDALLDLYRDDRMQPGAAEVAARAGVSERTVFRLFADLESLAAAAIERQTARVGHLFAPPDDRGTREERIAALVAQRITLYREIGPVVRAAQLRLPFSAVLRAGFDRRHRLLRRQVEQQFRLELDASREPDRAQLLSALALATGIETLEQLHYIQGATLEAAGATITRIVRALLSDIR